MHLADAPDVFGYTLFCDDIRAEIDGKFSFIGTYPAGMSTNAPFPLTLPKFAFSINFFQKRGAFVADLGLRILLPGDPEDAPSIQSDLSESARQAEAAAFARQTREAAQGQEPYIILRANLIFAPLTIPTPGDMRVRIVRGNDIFRMGSIEILAGPPSV